MTSSSPRSSSDTVLCLSYLPLPDEHRPGNSDIGGSGLTAHDETLGSELPNLDYELATFFGASESRARDDGPDEAHHSEDGGGPLVPDLVEDGKEHPVAKPRADGPVQGAARDAHIALHVAIALGLGNDEGIIVLDYAAAS